MRHQVIEMCRSVRGNDSMEYWAADTYSRRKSYHSTA